MTLGLTRWRGVEIARRASELMQPAGTQRRSDTSLDLAVSVAGGHFDIRRFDKKGPRRRVDIWTLPQPAVRAPA